MIRALLASPSDAIYMRGMSWIGNLSEFAINFQTRIRVYFRMLRFNGENYAKLFPHASEITFVFLFSRVLTKFETIQRLLRSTDV